MSDMKFTVYKRTQQGEREFTKAAWTMPEAQHIAEDLAQEISYEVRGNLVIGTGQVGVYDEQGEFVAEFFVEEEETG